MPTRKKHTFHFEHTAVVIDGVRHPRLPYGEETGPRRKPFYCPECGAGHGSLHYLVPLRANRPMSPALGMDGICVKEECPKCRERLAAPCACYLAAHPVLARRLKELHKSERGLRK